MDKDYINGNDSTNRMQSQTCLNFAEVQPVLCNDTSKYLQKSVEDYAGFVCQVLRDDTFLVELNRTMPFDKMVHAAMRLGKNSFDIRKMGISVMRMDIEPPLYSLAVTIMFKGGDGLMQNHSIFINACKTVEELQQLVAEEDFKKEVLALCEDRVLSKQFVLTENKL